MKKSEASISVLVLIAFFLLVSINDTKAQINASLIKVGYPSPAAMEMQKYGEYPIGHFTGIPDIKIPLYEIKTPRITLPIELQNHPSGFKPTMFNGSVGVAWTLKAGGRLTRTVYGAPDDQATFPNGFAQRVGFDNYSDYEYLKSIDEGAKDTEYDLFSFDVSTDAGNFVLKNSTPVKTPLTTTYRPLKITYEKNSTGDKFIAFTIINEEGTIFRFGKSLRNGTEYHELSQTSQGGTVRGFVSSWLLTEIISSDRSDTVSFNYVQSSVESKRAVGDKIVAKDLTLSASVENSYSTYGMQLSDIMVINEIKFKNGRVSFEYNTDKSKLLKIKVYPEVVTTPIKVFSFSSSRYDNFTNFVKLDSLKILNGSETDSSQKYLFTYYNNLSLPNNAEIEKMTDWWGFYNQSTYSSILPSMNITIQGTTAGTYTYSIGGPNANRSPSELHTKNYMLESIRYPTGGKTKFEYELNKYYDNGVKDAGGLRITKISNYNNDTLIGFKSYKYGIGENGYGIAVLKVGQLPHFSFSNLYVSVDEIFQPTSYRGTSYNARFSTELQGALSSPVCYEQVTEYTRDPTNNIGKTVYKYNYQNPTHGIYSPQNSEDNTYNLYLDKHNGWSFGKLIEKVDYKREQNGSYTEVQRLRNTYLDFKKEEIRGLRLRRYCYSSQGSNDMSEYIVNYSLTDIYPNYQFGFYYIESGDKKLYKSENIQYSGTDSVKTVTLFYYTNTDYLEPTRTVRYGSKGDSLVLLNRTPLDKSIIHASTPLSSTASEALDSMVSRNILANVQSEEFLNNTLKRKVLIAYKLQNSKIVTQHEIYEQIKTNLIEKITEFLNFDNTGNILQQQKTNDVTQSFIWDYNSTYSVTEATNADVADIAYTSFESDGKGNWTYSGSPAPDVTAPTGKKIYDLSSGNITKSINSATTYIISYWRPTGLPTLTISGTITGYPISGRTVNGWKYYEHKISAQNTATISGSGNIDELRLYPASALITTYTYEPLIGMTSQCDVNNRITYYEYDGFGRLALVRDQDKNIIKKLCYNYAGQPEGCLSYPSAAKSGVFSKACSGCDIGSAVTYTVPEGRYTAQTQTEADALAQNDVNTNGQAYANANGTCTAPSNANISVTNTSFSSASVTFTDNCSHVSYFYNIDPYSSTTFGPIPAGTYRVDMSAAGTHTYYINSYSQTSSIPVNFNNIPISGTATVEIN
ncbi:DUF5977 domain-containing protein [Agriterribacter sp.]|uniref:DUF5977 domain-containing protein n=1 Tax=Agriterribacter sp. TaxID=2821509 RepID=UPI002C5478BF|nr:DUF5977 domain-containing protein [Agriterribacter sp.]HTN08698.1 DUF5977 domain-containing protein [Agriterribacter sp.]